MKIRNKFKFSNTSKERRKNVSRYLIRCSDRALMCSPVDFGVPYLGGGRTDEEQNGAFKEGNSSCDGYIKKSFHQIKNAEGEFQALDLVPYVVGIGFDYSAFGRFGIIGMLMIEAFEELQSEGLIPEGLFLHWGGLWSHKKKGSLGWDSAHFELRDYEQVIRL